MLISSGHTLPTSGFSNNYDGESRASHEPPIDTPRRRSGRAIAPSGPRRGPFRGQVFVTIYSAEGEPTPQRTRRGQNGGNARPLGHHLPSRPGHACQPKSRRTRRRRPLLRLLETTTAGSHRDRGVSFAYHGGFKPGTQRPPIHSNDQRQNRHACRSPSRSWIERRWRRLISFRP